jgi:SWI/SNF-related matrix-associated actin-dependent regulator of chromatin subfamily A-like protein 1
VKKTAILNKHNQFSITFDYDISVIMSIRTLPGRQWDPKNRQWHAPNLPGTADKLVKWGFTIVEPDAEWIMPEEVKLAPIKKLTLIPEGLFPFQVEDVQRIEQFGGRALLALEMGLGKTIISLAWLRCHPELRPTIIVVPATIKLVWCRQIATWLPGEEVHALYGAQATHNLRDLRGIIVVNYELLIMKLLDSKRTLAEYLADKVKPKAVVVDEVHFVSNLSTQRTRAVRLITSKCKHILALSGTPATSRPAQFFPILSMMYPTAFPSFFHFAMKFCGPKNTGWGWDFSGSSNAGELHKLLLNLGMLRRKKEDVLKDLPAKIRDVVPMEITNRVEYDTAEADFIEWLISKGETEKAERARHAEAVTRMEGLKQLAVRGKLDRVVEWISDFLEDSDGKLIVFTHHIEIRDALSYKFPGVSIVALGGDKTQKAADIFQQDPKVRVFIGNIDSAGVGITLTAASTVAFVELPWTPGKCSQAEDRAHRIGQKDTVNVHFLVAKDTIEEDIAGVLDRKAKMLTKVMDGVDVEDGSLLTELLEKYRGGNNEHGMGQH